MPVFCSCIRWRLWQITWGSNPTMTKVVASGRVGAAQHLHLELVTVNDVNDELAN